MEARQPAKRRQRSGAKRARTSHPESDRGKQQHRQTPSQPTDDGIFDLRRGTALVTAPLSAGEESAGEADTVGTIHETAGTARKRELERQRRGLIHTRFLELDRELACKPMENGEAPAARRIDREILLKDAVARLSTQKHDLRVSSERISALFTEVETLQAEKRELRADKAYLYEELRALRAETQHLRSDNIRLWQVIRKSFGFKSALPQEMAKLSGDSVPRASAFRRMPSQTVPTAPVAAEAECMPSSTPSLPPAMAPNTTSTPLGGDGRDSERLQVPGSAPLDPSFLPVAREDLTDLISAFVETSDLPIPTLLRPRDEEGETTPPNRLREQSAQPVGSSCIATPQPVESDERSRVDLETFRARTNERVSHADLAHPDSGPQRQEGTLDETLERHPSDPDAVYRDPGQTVGEADGEYLDDIAYCA